ncbi:MULTISPECIES: hypothetical protein [Dictyoglomus]|uniref:CBM11 domain-containing protein n=1 Tax=Dictyoglomus turgidum (strain DSM 6724 / Z-1310) TaxID=515635 RepID=B8E2L6_DICTD|nr:MULTISPECIES: hypothetical protein [Dictyoglomus]ACK42860.1 conserved hypothetical protein [Dictyoglomus turgidum DSM 6724]HBU30922.1 hypothetical protein [Dictyoglomus sp.]
MKKVVLISLISLLLLTVSFSQSVKEIVIYDGETENTNLSALGYWIAPEGCKVEEMEGIAYSGKKCLKIDFVWNSWWAGMGINFAKWNFEDKDKILDLSNYKALEFYIRAEKLDNYNLLVTIVEAPAQKDGKEFYSEKYTVMGGVPTQWTKVSIPLKSFVTVDKKRIWGMSIEVTGIPEGKAVLYVDNIKFVKD